MKKHNDVLNIALDEGMVEKEQFGNEIYNRKAYTLEKGKK